MGLKHQLIPVYVAPSAHIALAMFAKIDGALEFSSPPRVDHLATRFIDEHQRSRLQQRIHEPVVSSDKCIPVVLQIQRVQEHQWKLAPALDGAAQISGSPHVDPGVER